MSKRIVTAAVAALAFVGCAGERAITGVAASRVAAAGADAPGVVYTLTNQTAGNAVAVFARATDGTLTAAGAVPTGGTGTGAGLGSQGALALSADGRLLFAVNAGSNDVSVFRVGATGGLTLAGRVPSGGTTPISLTVSGGLLYVLNAGGDGNITGFSVGVDGALLPVPGSTRPLSGSAVGPAQIAFSPDGRFLVVTEKNTNRIDVYAVDGGGGPAVTASAGATPFGFAFGLRNELFVSEAAGSASSYVLGEDGGLSTVSAAVATNQGAPCWVAVTADGRFAYTANTQGRSVSGFAVSPDGALALIDADGATARVGAAATDVALSVNSRYLYQLAGTEIAAFGVAADGHLAPAGVVSGLPAGTVGLVAR